MSKVRQTKLNELLNFNNGRIAPKEQGDIPIYGGNGILGFTNESNYENILIMSQYN